jgi:Derlin-2/3
MAAILGNHDGGMGQLGQFPLEQWFFEMPPCTRYWTTATVITSILLQCKIVTPYQLFYSFRSVYYKSQYWRLATTFVYFGPPSLDLVFHVFFLQRYSRLLESGSGTSPATFSWLLLYATTTLLALSSLTTAIPFLGSALSSTLIYIWSRRNPDTRLSFLGLLVFTAPYLPWVLMAFNLCMHGTIPKDEILGVVVGHVYYFFADVWPGLYDGQRPMDPPEWWVRLWEGRRPQTSAREIEGDLAAAAAAARPTDLRR